MRAAGAVVPPAGAPSSSSPHPPVARTAISTVQARTSRRLWHERAAARPGQNRWRAGRIRRLECHRGYTSESDNIVFYITRVSQAAESLQKVLSRSMGSSVGCAHEWSGQYDATAL